MSPSGRLPPHPPRVAVNVDREDTGFLYALIDADDASHARVREVLEHERGRRLFDSVITTNHVMAEVLTLLRTRGKQDLNSAERVALAFEPRGRWRRGHPATGSRRGPSTP